MIPRYYDADGIELLEREKGRAKSVEQVEQIIVEVKNGDVNQIYGTPTNIYVDVHFLDDPEDDPYRLLVEDLAKRIQPAADFY